SHLPVQLSPRYRRDRARARRGVPARIDSCRPCRGPADAVPAGRWPHHGGAMEERRLRDTNEMLQAIVRASPLALEVLDTEGRIEVWNPAAERVFGWTEPEVLGQPDPTIPEE